MVYVAIAYSLQMASEEEKPGDFHLKNFLQVESANNDGAASSLESTHSAESESASSSCLTQIEAISSSSSRVIEIEASSSTLNQTKANFADAKVEADQSSSVRIFSHTSGNDNSISTTTMQGGTLVNLKSGNGESIQSDSFISKDGKKSTSESAEGDENENEGKDDDDFDQSYDDDTISSEAVVDDIELILMPETLTDFPPMDLSPQLVRVTELKRPGDYDTDVFEDDDEGRSELESDFQKFGTDDEEGVSASERSMSSRSNLHRRRVHHLSSFGGDRAQNEETEDQIEDGAGGGKSIGKVHSGSQTEITALETFSPYNPFEFKQQQQHRRRSVGKSSSNRGVGLGTMPGTSSSGGGRKHLNWKSELTLLPSKTKIRATGFSGYDEVSTNYQDQYSPRVAKFTSQVGLSRICNFLTRGEIINPIY